MAKKVLKEVPSTLKKDEKPIFLWQSAEFVSQKKDTKRTIYLFVVALFLAVFFYYQGLISSAVVTIVSFFALVLMTSLKPRMVKSAIFSSGMLVDEKVYFFDQFKSFHLIQGEIFKIRFQPTGLFTAPLTLPVSEDSDVDLSQLILYLSKKLPQEDDHSEDLIDRVNRFFKL